MLHLNKDLGFLRIAAAIPALKVADIDFNAGKITEMITKAADAGVQVLAFPEMSLTGYTIADLVQQSVLLKKAESALQKILESTAGRRMLVVMGMPVETEQRIFNCAVVLSAGRILGVMPKTFLPNYREYYEARWFSPAREAVSNTVTLAGQNVPFGTDILLRLNGDATIGVEICEDLWLPLSPHEYQAANGAEVLLNLSASNEILGKSDWRRAMIASESGRCIAAYCYASCGIGESSNDVVFGGHALIAENGIILEESQRFSHDAQMVIADIDVERLQHDRRVMTTFHELSMAPKEYRRVDIEVDDPVVVSLQRKLNPHPFVPAESAQRAERCRDIFAMQVSALAQKLKGAGKENIVLGVSGGLDSTLALLVAVKTMDYLGLPRLNVHAYNLPGFGTTSRTKNNASRLAKALGVTFGQININRSAQSHLKDLGHAGHEDIVFENVQARYRTEFFFNKANGINGINLGTGDLTEVALGWSTFSGDQTSHYHVNVSVPKTLVKYLVRWVADEEQTDKAAQKALYDVLDTPISPELKRARQGDIVQKSEDIIGPVELADFFLYPFIRFGMKPGKILFLANEVNNQGLFDGKYSLDDLHKWLKSFIQRFFANQFKRTSFPEGPKIGSVSLSPRGDWRMPSEASPALWLEDLEEMYRKLQGKTP
jgi:NAD+ synthase (glutamine-hydrolysing)